MSFLIIGPITKIAIDQYGQRDVLLVVGAMFVVVALSSLTNLRRVSVSQAEDGTL